MFGTVVAVHISSGIVGASPTGKLVVDLPKLQPVARCGGVTYTRASELYDLPRPRADGTYA